MQIKINPMNPSHHHATTYSRLQYNLLLFLNVDQKIVLLLLFFSVFIYFCFSSFFCVFIPKILFKKSRSCQVLRKIYTSDWLNSLQIKDCSLFQWNPGPPQERQPLELGVTAPNPNCKRHSHRLRTALLQPGRTCLSALEAWSHTSKHPYRRGWGGSDRERDWAVWENPVFTSLVLSYHSRRTQIPQWESTLLPLKLHFKPMCVCVFSSLFKSRLYDSMLPDWRRGCKGTRGRTKRLMWPVCVPGGPPVLLRCGPGAGKAAPRWPGRRRWWRAWQKRPASRLAPQSPALSCSSRWLPLTRPCQFPGRHWRRCCQSRSRLRHPRRCPGLPRLCWQTCLCREVGRESRLNVLQDNLTRRSKHSQWSAYHCGRRWKGRKIKRFNHFKADLNRAEPYFIISPFFLHAQH